MLIIVLYIFCIRKLDGDSDNWGSFFLLINLVSASTQAEKAEREARDLKGSMRKRMEFLDFD